MKLMNILKKTIKHKCFKWFIFAQLILAFLFVYLPLSTYKPIDKSQAKYIHLNHPAVVFDRHANSWWSDSHRITIVYDDVEYVYNRPGHVDNIPGTDVYECLQTEPYLNIAYLDKGDCFEIVELQGKNTTYYTIDDCNLREDKDLFWLIIALCLWEFLYVVTLVWWIVYFVLDKPLKLSRGLKKKHPVEKHVYYDEENEFSPYKQKLIEQEREED